MVSNTSQIESRSFHGILHTRPFYPSLVGTLEWRHGLALVLIQSVGLNGTVVKVDLAVGLLLPGEGVLHPLVIVTLGVVLTGVSTTGLLAVSGSDGGLGTVIKC